MWEEKFGSTHVFSCEKIQSILLPLPEEKAM